MQRIWACGWWIVTAKNSLSVRGVEGENELPQIAWARRSTLVHLGETSLFQATTEELALAEAGWVSTVRNSVTDNTLIAPRIKLGH